MFSRSGLPFTAKSVTGVDRTDVYKPIICTPEAFDTLSGRNNGHRRLVDVRERAAAAPVRRDVLRATTPRSRSRNRDRAPTARPCASACDGLAWRPLRSRARELAIRYGRFDAEELFFGHQPKYDTTGDYEAFVYDGFADDLREAEVPDGASPVKSAAEVFRIFRDPMRSVVEQGGLVARLLSGFQRRHPQPHPSARRRSARAPLPAVAGADGRRRCCGCPYGPAPAMGRPTGEDRDRA